MTPSVICQALFAVVALLSLAIILVVRSNHRNVIELKKQHWEAFLTERRKSYDSGWNNGYEFRKSLEDVILNVALDHISEGDLDMSGKDRIVILVAQMLEKIETRYELFHESVDRTSPLLTKITFYTTMIQLMKDNPSTNNPETAEVERHVVRHLIRLRNKATKEMVEMHEAESVG